MSDIKRQSIELKEETHIYDIPLVSIVILTCNRKDMVLELIHDIKKQKYDQIEIILVINNASTEVVEWFKSRASGVEIIGVSANLGCAGRNLGIKKARGQILVTIDDDVFFHRENEINNIVEFFTSHADAHALNFKILFPENKRLIPFNWFHPRDFHVYENHTFLTDYISEGAVSFKKEIFSKLDEYYPEEFFLSHEGPDLAYRLLDNGFNIYYSGNIEVLHKCSLVQRTSWRNVYFDSRNYLWLLIRHFPMRYIFVKSSLALIMGFLFSVRRGHLIWFLRAIVDSVKGIPCQAKKRKVLSKETITRLEEIRKYQPGFLMKVRRHFEKTKAMNLKHVQR